MPINISHWSPGVLAAAATCLAATVAAVTGFVVAAINSWSARKLAREAAQRNFRLTNISPYLEYIDSRIAIFGELLNVGPGYAASMGKVLTLLPSEPVKAAEEFAKEVDEAVARLRALQSKMAESKEIYRAGLYTMLLSDRYVLDSVHRFINAEITFTDSIFSEGGLLSITPENFKKFKEHELEVLTAAVRLRMAVESFIFGNRGVIRRGIYFIWSKARPRKKRYLAP